MWPFRREERAAPQLTLEQLLADTSTPTAAGVHVSVDQAQRLASVWACVRLLSETVATLPLDAFRDGVAMPLPPLMREPAAGMARHEFLEAIMRSLLLRGNSYAMITARSGSTLLPLQVEPLDPDQVAVRLTDAGTVEYRVAGRVVDRDRIWHVRANVVPGSPLGLSPVEHFRECIGSGLAAERFGSEFFGAGSIPAGILSTDQQIPPTQASAVLDAWNHRQRGHRGTALLTQGIKFQPISVKPEESQFIESQRFNVTQIARIFGVPPEMIGGDAGNSMTYANTESRALDFLRYSLNPWIIRLETALGRLLPSTQDVRFNVDALLRATTTERYAAHSTALAAGFMTIDEVRALENLPPLPAAPGPPSPSDEPPEVVA